ncbi:MAG TPA: hypothetical protein DIC31_06155, partial [Rhizobiales bacterium]|nr:hypothetical protein [Hyphomicrobiales bacterium]
MIVWDRGRWLPEGDPHSGLTKGHLAFSLEGTRLKGRWHLVRIRPRAGEKTEPLAPDQVRGRVLPPCGRGGNHRPGTHLPDQRPHQ